jgi:hypothetical protein
MRIRCMYLKTSAEVQVRHMFRFTVETIVHAIFLRVVAITLDTFVCTSISSWQVKLKDEDHIRAGQNRRYLFLVLEYALNSKQWSSMHLSMLLLVRIRHGIARSLYWLQYALDEIDAMIKTGRLTRDTTIPPSTIYSGYSKISASPCCAKDI